MSYLGLFARHLIKRCSQRPQNTDHAWFRYSTVVTRNCVLQLKVTLTPSLATVLCDTSCGNMSTTSCGDTSTVEIGLNSTESVRDISSDEHVKCEDPNNSTLGGEKASKDFRIMNETSISSVEPLSMNVVQFSERSPTSTSGYVQKTELGMNAANGSDESLETNTCKSIADDGINTDTTGLNKSNLMEVSSLENNVKDLQPNMSKRALKRLKRAALEKKPKGKNNVDKPRGFSEDVFSESDYYFENGLRKVYPYFFTFNTYVKERWFGKTVAEVFQQEFKVDDSELSVKETIESGAITINGKKVDVNYKLKNGHHLEHEMHRHENPVLDTPLEIISDCEDLIVINKPSSIPCHPCGRYRYNSVVFILGKEFGYSNLRTIYRLDRLTSGVLMCGKTDRKTKELEKQIVKRQVQKEYVCRVCGKFPDGSVEVNQPLGCISHKLAVWRVDPNGKPSVTKFERLSYNCKSSVVKCFPLTGRTHQIRVHLQFLGHPIINDPIYNSTAFGPDKGKNGEFGGNLDDICNRIISEHNIGLWLESEAENPLYTSRLAEIKEQKEKLNKTALGCESESLQGISIDTSEETAASDEPCDIAGSISDDSGEPDRKRLKVDQKYNNETTVKNNSFRMKLGFDPSKWIPSENCPNCRKKYLDPTRKQLIMFLHALKYSGPNWEYSTPLPDWAMEDWHGDEEEPT